jgi:CheY-like chemotaxis protein
LLGLINELLDLAKIEAGRGTMEIVPSDLGRLIRDVTEMMRVRAVEKNLELKVIQTPAFPGFVETDAPRLRQMLINLLGNAIKHTERGSVTLRLDAQRKGDAEQMLLSFEVEDTGIGIAVEDQERIFEPFVQVGKGPRQKGTGLGLTITRQYAILLGGTIRVSSAPGEGALFRLELPAKSAEPVVPEPAETEQEYILAAGQPEFRILVVDDAPESRLLMRRLLVKAGFEVRVAKDGAEAVESFPNWRPHFIWMDLRMHGIDGAEAVRRIRAIEGGEQVRIAAVTASENTHSAVGMDDIVRKPYRAHEIFECMERHLDLTWRLGEPTAQKPSAQPSAGLRPEALAALPENLRAALTDAVVTLDAGQINAVIKRISDVDAALGSALAYYADRFSLTLIWEALKESKGIYQ